jgi:hypothetical protein
VEGSTLVRLKGANADAVHEAMEVAWRERAPKKMTRGGVTGK